MEGIVKEVRECARNYRKKKGRKNDTSGDELPVHKQLKGSLNKCLPQMMFGFGDEKEPLQETVDAVESIVFERMAALAARCIENQHTSFAASQPQGKGKITADDLLFEMRKDKRKHHRCRELLRLNEEIKQAKKSYEKPEMLEG